MKYAYHKLLASRWHDFAASNNIDNLLLSEIKDYHLIAKDPDNGPSFRRFYSILESLHLSAANQQIQNWSNGSNKLSLGLLSSSSLRHSNVPEDARLIVLKGTIDLAHGDVLKKQILNACADSKSRLIVILIDYGCEQAFSLTNKLGCTCVGLSDASGNSISLQERYQLIVEFMLYNSLKIRSCIWWGIPFGMIYTYSLYVHALKLLGLKKKTSLDYLTVKHHFSWTDFCVDNIYSSLPLVEGFDLPRPNIKYFQAAFYDKNVLTMSYDVSDKESKLLNFLVGLRNKGFYVMTSASRAEKTDNQEYIASLDKILDKNAKSILLVFGKICRNL